MTQIIMIEVLSINEVIEVINSSNFFDVIYFRSNFFFQFSFQSGNKVFIFFNSSTRSFKIIAMSK